MIEHTEIRRKLSDFLDDAVTDAERRVIEAHLAECEQCRKALAELGKTIALMKTLPEVEPPPWLTAKIMAKVGDEAPRPSLWRRLFLPLHVKLPVEAFAILFICVMGYYLARNNAHLASPSATLPAREESARPAEAPAAPAAPAPAARNVPSPGGNLKSPPSSAPRQAAPQPKSAVSSAAQGVAASTPPLPAPAPLPEAPAAPASVQRAARSHAPSFDASVSQSPLSLMGTPAPQTGALTTDGHQPRTGAKKGGEQLKANERYERSSSEGSRQKGGAALSRQAVPPEGVDSKASLPGLLQEESGQAGTLPTAPGVEIALTVSDPVAAVDGVERAVSRCGGTIVKRSYEALHHRLVARVEAAKLSSLSQLLAKIGTIQKPPQPRDEEATAVEVTISW